MQLVDGKPYYSASDLNNYLECAHLTALDLQAVLRGERPPSPRTGTPDIIARKGEDHERRYLAALKSDGVLVAELPDKSEPTVKAFLAAEVATLAAMVEGAPVIYQGAFFDGQFIGRSDFLLRVDRPSARWAHSYEVLDCKLALHTKPYFLLQLCHYSEQIERLQGSAPEFMHVLLGNGEKQQFRVSDYSAYYRQLKKSFLRDVEAPSGSTYPVPTDHCEVCRWDNVCDAKRRADDHLRLVASMRNDQVVRFHERGVMSVAQLAAASPDRRPRTTGVETFERLRRQAQLQLHQRETGQHKYELLDHAAWIGFGSMPEPAVGDVFFDMEGDPLFDIGTGLEYLFGCWLPDDEQHFKAFWGLDRAREKRAFEDFIDFIVARRLKYPSMHVYHYATYEKTALQKLSQRHATHEDLVDELLRAEVFVDLFAVVRQTMMISQESYSIKKLEPFYKFERTVDLRRGDDSIVMFEQWLAEPTDRGILNQIAQYNKDDCRSTFELREWLRERRAEAEGLFGRPMPFREVKRPGAPCHDSTVEGCKDCEKRAKVEREIAQTSATQTALLAAIAKTPETREDLREMSEDSRVRYLLANLIAYHRREDKPILWQYFDRCQNPDELIESDKECLGGLVLDETVAPFKYNRDQNYTWTYRFPDQQYDLTKGTLMDPESRAKVGHLSGEIDEDNNVVRINLTREFQSKPRAVTALIPLEQVEAGVQKDALRELGERYLEGSLRQGALMDILTAAAPRLTDRATGSVVQPPKVTAEALYDVISRLDSSLLFIQGPPGTGKSTKASAVIARLLKEHKRVGVMSNSHKAVHNLNRKIEDAATRLSVQFRGVHKASKQNKSSPYRSTTGHIDSSFEPIVLAESVYSFVSGTSWLFASAAMEDQLDYLFVDEAGQISLADAVAVARSARNIVLIGDPLQLAQVSQGTHPIGVGGSVLQHLLGDHETIPDTKGIFLNESYRLHPTICEFISAALYEGRLDPGPDTVHHKIGNFPEYGNGLHYFPVDHTGNSRESPEEAARVSDIVAELIGAEVVEVVDKQPITRPARTDDILVVSPYNAQRRLIRRLLQERGLPDVQVGTVDKFQGQEAFAVIYSMATSSERDAPRGLGFLLDKNRFNVAISRCKALPIVICSNALVESRCDNVSDMGLVSLLCSYQQSAIKLR